MVVNLLSRKVVFRVVAPGSRILGDDGISIAFMELVYIVTSAVVWGSQWRRKHIVLYCDNASWYSTRYQAANTPQMLFRTVKLYYTRHTYVRQIVC